MAIPRTRPRTFLAVLLALALLAPQFALAPSARAADPCVVTSEENDGPGSLRVAVPSTPPLTGAAWAHLAPRLSRLPRRGKRRWAPRALLVGILWVMRTGASWREVPEYFAP